MARTTAPSRIPARTVVRWVPVLLWIVLSAIALGFLLGLARPRKDAAGRPLTE